MHSNDFSHRLGKLQNQRVWSLFLFSLGQKDRLVGTDWCHLSRSGMGCVGWGGVGWGGVGWGGVCGVEEAASEFCWAIVILITFSFR